jgi:hypothetical protein
MTLQYAFIALACRDPLWIHSNLTFCTRLEKTVSGMVVVQARAKIQVPLVSSKYIEYVL